MLTTVILAGLLAANYEVAAIHPHDPRWPASTMRGSAGSEFSITGMTIRNVIWLAWQLPPERVIGGPKWLDSDLYDILAKAPSGSAKSMDAQRPRIQALLKDRFQLKVHSETRAESVYELSILKTGLRMHEAKEADLNALPWNLFLVDLSRRLGRPMIDKTGLKGVWNIKLQYTPNDGNQAAPGPSIFTAMREQLGLKLDSAKGPVDILVIDSIARPSPN